MPDSYTFKEEVSEKVSYTDEKTTGDISKEEQGIGHKLVVGQVDPHTADKLTTEVHDAQLSAGVAKVEAAQAVWGRKGYLALLGGVFLVYFIYSLDGVTTFQYLAIATSSFGQHSMLGTVQTASGIIISIGKPFYAKLSDYLGRAEIYIITCIMYIIGYILYASSQNVGAIAGGQVMYSFGYTGLQMVTSVVLADVTTLKYRAFAAGVMNLPWVLNTFIGGFIYQGILDANQWRWGYGMFIIMFPVCLAPVVASLLWGQWKAKKEGILEIIPNPDKDFFRNPIKATITANKEMDFPGLIFVGLALALILLPFTLAPAAVNGWQTPSFIAMITVGGVILFIFAGWELYFAERFGYVPIAPLRFFKNGNIAGSILVNFLDFVSFYLQYTYQSSFVMVTKTEWSWYEMFLFNNVQTIGLCSAGIISGTILLYWKRPKFLMIAGLLVRLLGAGLMIHARGALGPDVELVWCQLLQGLGGGFASTISSVMAQAMVPHTDMAVVTALVLLFAEVGNSIGSAIATAVWGTQMPHQLSVHVPGNNATLNAELFGAITKIMDYPADDPIRIGAITAYGEVMKNLCIGATIVAIFPPIVAYFFLTDIKLDDKHNQFDNRDLAGRKTEETVKKEQEEKAGVTST
ncbi:major facilitator superfamily domain-containing protein [Zychaea mexicana]|uniref:major facilitator superfamily domain-containing protein n=1 Tax=Zychaea mexicana TaxID=64656 RepID=UPI0022FECE03|nr:major facilitator superfamily domain-containing protein [Zychaea mexicana]KAI9489570.1 major facilitator superfamily domain-containing protein [Zychaea mexicana]